MSHSSIPVGSAPTPIGPAVAISDRASHTRFRGIFSGAYLYSTSLVIIDALKLALLTGNIGLVLLAIFAVAGHVLRGALGSGVPVPGASLFVDARNLASSAIHASRGGS